MKHHKIQSERGTPDARANIAYFCVVLRSFHVPPLSTFGWYVTSSWSLQKKTIFEIHVLTFSCGEGFL